MLDLPGLFHALGLEPPSDDRLFLSVLTLHIVLGVTCVITGIGAMVSPKRMGRHPTCGTLYVWGLAALFVTASTLVVMRPWAEGYHLFFLGAFSFGSAWLGRTIHRQHKPGWMRLHIIAMGLSYVFMLTAFYVDNGPRLPIWKSLPPLVFWLLPGALGTLLIVRSLQRNRLIRTPRSK